MIPFLRSLSELEAITDSREIKKEEFKSKSNKSKIENKQSKRYNSQDNSNEIKLPDLPKTIRRKWINNKESLSKFIDTLDYNNQIQPSYDLTLLKRQTESNQKDVA